MKVIKQGIFAIHVGIMYLKATAEELNQLILFN